MTKWNRYDNFSSTEAIADGDTFLLRNLSDTTQSSIGSVNEVTYSILKEGFSGVRSVKSYGATGDGSTDDTAAIQACVDAESVVYFSPGTYIVLPDGSGDPALQLKSNLLIIGSPGATVKCHADINNPSNNFRLIGINDATATSYENIVIRGLTIDGNTTLTDPDDAPQSHGIFFYSAGGISNVWIQNNIVKDVIGDSIRFHTGCSNLWITDNRIIDYKRAGIQLAGNTQDVTITGNKVSVDASAVGPDGGIRLEPSAATYARRIVVRDNHTDLLVLSGADVDNYCSQIIVESNVVDEYIVGNFLEDYIIKDNIVRGLTAASNTAKISLGRARRLKIEGNTVYQPTAAYSGIEVHVAAGQTYVNQDIHIVNNYVNTTVDSVGNANSIGIEVLDSDNVLVSGNIVSGKWYSGIVCSGTIRNRTNNQIINNPYVSGETYGIYVEGTSTSGIDYPVVAGNYVSGAGTYDIYFKDWNATPDVTNVRVYGNTLVNDSKVAFDTTVTFVNFDQMGGPETATGTYTLLPSGATEIDSSGGAVTGTLGSGEYVGQIKAIVMTDATSSSTVSITNHQTSDPEVATFDAVDETGVFMWTGTEWITIFATCTFV